MGLPSVGSTKNDSRGKESSDEEGLQEPPPGDLQALLSVVYSFQTMAIRYLYYVEKKAHRLHAVCKVDLRCCRG
ncbi:hypothetical protein FRB94_013881 [Tulasnella sp. JGI-2019a]|nr:hypothetical protein FRB94_013881 [Tulasnella sp. JGI-2019a]